MVTPMTDDAAIRDLLACYALALDADDVDGCLQLFADDAAFEVFGKSFSGHERIRRMLQSAPHGLHLTGISHVDIRGSTATVRSQVLFVEAGNLQLRPALYDDELTRDSNRWRFRRRRCQFITSGGLSDRSEAPPS